MEDLTKQQIVLVTLLVSFVTSIATGIVTVTLMDQAPAGVTQTINRVVERTIERVVQEPSKTQSTNVVTKETVVVKEDDLVVSAVEKNSQSLVRLELGTKDNPTVAALGVMLTKDGIFAVDSGNTAVGATYSARLADGMRFEAMRIYNAEAQGLVLFKVVTEKDAQIIFPVAPLGDSDGLKLGQTVVLLSGKDSTTVKTGIVSNLRYEKKNQTAQSTTTPVAQVQHVVDISTNIEGLGSLGGILSTLSGQAVGFGPIAFTGRFLASNLLTSALQDYYVWYKELNTPKPL